MPLNKHSRFPNHDQSPDGQPRNDSNRSLVKSLKSVKATIALGRAIGHQLHGGEIIALTGELGAGKTVLAQGIASGIGVSPNHVTSPTFSFIHEYSGRVRFVHVDLFRINNRDELKAIGLEGYYDPYTSVVVEWADRIGNEFSQDHLTVHLAHTQRYVRLATITANGPISYTLLQRLRTETYP